MAVLLAETGDFPDIEALVLVMLRDVQIDGVPLGPDRTGTRTPVDMTDPYIHVVTAPVAGGMNADRWSETVNLYIATTSPDRARSRAMRSGVRAILGEYGDGGEYRGVLIDRAWESSAPGPLPTQDGDDRRVECSWAFRVRRHYGETVYLDA